MRQRLVRTLLALGVASGMMSAGGLTVQADDPASRGPTATLHGTPIPLVSVGNHHCHDLAWPVIRCFPTADDRDADAERTSRQQSLDSVSYVVAFEHDNYAGVSITFSRDQPNLSTIGWNDAITSFKSLNGGHPRFWDNANYGTPYWQWATGAWVPNVGSGPNDKISSLKNVP